MELGAGPPRGVFAAVDVHYPSSGGARAAVVPEVRAYRPGEFFLRELPPLRAVLRSVDGLGLLVVDGYADLDPAGRPGLGAHAHAEFGVPVIGVAKSAGRRVPVPYRSCGGPLRARCSSPPPACPALTQLTWSGT
jgi:deoxyribonuclease V